VGSISANNSFLQISGDLIRAMRLVSIAQEQGLSFSVTDIFRQPRLYDLANVTKIGLNKLLKAMAPFSLIGASLDVGVMCTEVAARYSIQLKQIKDIFPYTPL
jgi:hypothetical protein